MPLTLGVASRSLVQPLASGPVISIQITIQCTAAEVLELGQSLRKMLQDLASPEVDETDGQMDSSLELDADS